jgi:hypothetical protein
MNTTLLSLDESSKTLNRDDMSWFYNEYSDVVLTRTSIRFSLNQRPRARTSAHERMSHSCEPPGFGGKGELCLSPPKLPDNLIGCLLGFLREKEKNIGLFLFSSLFDSLGICFSVVRIVPL